MPLLAPVMRIERACCTGILLYSLRGRVYGLFRWGRSTGTGMPHGVVWAVATWWALAVIVNLTTVVIGLAAKRKKGRGRTDRAISVIVPVKGADAALPANLQAFFQLDHPT